MADLTKVIKGLKCFTNVNQSATWAECKERNCSYRGMDCELAVMKDAAELLEKQSIKIADLKLERKKLRSDPDRVKVVRCADCRYWEPENAEEGDSYGRCRNNYGPCQNQQTDMNWFCADGEREG